MVEKSMNIEVELSNPTPPAMWWPLPYLWLGSNS
jgi:ABC-type nitrate/sulfonate/bicarbonate transport system permease component